MHKTFYLTKTTLCSRLLTKCQPHFTVVSWLLTRGLTLTGHVRQARFVLRHLHVVEIGAHPPDHLSLYNHTQPCFTALCDTMLFIWACMWLYSHASLHYATLCHFVELLNQQWLQWTDQVYMTHSQHKLLPWTTLVQHSLHFSHLKLKSVDFPHSYLTCKQLLLLAIALTLIYLRQF